MGGDAKLVVIKVLPNGDIFHFGGNDAGSRIGHLCYFFAGFCFVWVVLLFEADVVERFVVKSRLPVFGRNAVLTFDIAASRNPLFADARNAFVKVDGNVGVGIDAAGVVDIDRLVGIENFFSIFYFYSGGQVDFPHRDTDRKNCPVLYTFPNLDRN